MTDVTAQSLDLKSLQQAYASGHISARDVIREVYKRVEARANDNTWIYLIPEDVALAQLDAADENAPLYGIPFAIKDNIDAAGHPTTAGCPAYAYTSTEDATVVANLQAAGAILIGKTNMDQFATGLVGVRSPYGPAKNAFDARYISGGSSAGSAVAVAAGLVSFALGTDTAGSGRVPAAFNNLVGLKPTRGLISAKGVVPACQSLDCVSIFALTVSDAHAVLDVAASFDADDPYSRQSRLVTASSSPLCIGIPKPDALQAFIQPGYPALYESAITTLEQLGHTVQEVDFTPFRETAELLYGGPWVSERVSAIESFYTDHKNDLHPVLRIILENAERYSAADVFNAMHKLEALRRRCDALWQDIDVLVTPTTSRIFTIDEVGEEPLELNSQLGYYTNFVNLLDYAALALPAGVTADGLPFGITAIAPAWRDALLVNLGIHFQTANNLPLGATQHSLPAASLDSVLTTQKDVIQVAVFGAHLQGQPLNSQLTERAAKLVKTCKTAPAYTFYALSGSQPAKPGLVRVQADGAAIEAEVWEMSTAAFGSFVALVPAPLVIGMVELEDGTWVKGFLCEPYALDDASEITHLGGWRAYLAEG
ncbi:MAG: allophanate hydrolase [Deinococcota bacterium]